MNCTIIYYEDNLTYIILQNVILGVMTTYVIMINIFTIWLTLIGTGLGKCAVNRLMLSSQVGNIIGGLSFYINEIYYSQRGTPGIGCKAGLDRYFLNYLGFQGNSMTLLFQSVSMHTGIVKNSWMLTGGKVSSAKTFLLIWSITVVLSVINVLLNWYHPSLQFVKAAVPSTLLVMISTALYIRILCSLSKSKASCRDVGRAESKLTKQSLS